jgi:hypothetical protein
MEQQLAGSRNCGAGLASQGVLPALHLQTVTSCHQLKDCHFKAMAEVQVATNIALLANTRDGFHDWLGTSLELLI